MEFKSFSDVNRDRCVAKDGFDHPLELWSLSDWMVAATGELGEAANILKKMNRVRDNIDAPNDPELVLLKEMFAKELADTYCYLDLLAQAAGIDLEQAVIAKFDEVSERIGYPLRLRGL